MPSVLLQFQLSADSTSGESRIFSRFFNEYRAVTTPTPGEDPRIKRAARFFRGGSPGLVDWQGSDADAIGTYPVPWEWTIVDGGWGARQSAHPDSVKSHLALVAGFSLRPLSLLGGHEHANAAGHGAGLEATGEHGDRRREG